MVGFSGLDGFLVFFFFPQVSPLLRVCVWLCMWRREGDGTRHERHVC